MSKKKSGICGNSDKNIVIPTRSLHYFLLFLVLIAVACQIPGASALSPSPNFPVPGWSVKNYYGGYPSQIFSFEIGKNVTNSGGPGNVFYNITGTYPLRSKVFWMDAGENVKVWAYYPYSISAGSYTMKVRPAAPGDTDVGSIRIERFTPATVPNNSTGIGVFQDSTHLFYLDYNGNDVWNGATVDRAYNFGIAGDIPVSGDWNHDGISEIGVYRPSTHLYYQDYNGNGVWNGATVDRAYNFGITGDIPVSGDWNHDGISEIGVFRPSTHTYYQDYNGNGVWNGATVDRAYNFGITGDIPVSGDWNNDGIYEIGVYRPSTHLYYQDFNGNGVWNGAAVDKAYNFGITGDSPVSGKW